MQVEENHLADQTVFSSLQELSPDETTEIAYQVLILLRHRAQLGKITAAQLLEPVRTNGLVEMKPALTKALAEAVEYIESKEGKPIDAIDDGGVAKYRLALDTLIFSKAPKAAGSTPATARKVLDGLRSGDRRHAAAAAKSRMVRSKTKAYAVRAEKKAGASLAAKKGSKAMLGT
jgi:hypothetical protein